MADAETPELIAYLNARYDEEEHLAKGGDLDSPDLTLRLDDDLRWVSVTPSRILADIESKRKILDEHGPETVWDGAGTEEPACTTCRYDDGTGTYPYGGCPTVRALAAPYAGRPDFPAERKP